jgi:hypothetical protein
MVLTDWISLGLLLIAILQPIAALRWSKHYRDAKSAEIAALNAQIATLERLTPKHLWEQIEALQNLSATHTRAIGEQLEQTQQKIDLLRNEGQQKGEQLAQAKTAYAQLSRDYEVLKLSAEQRALPPYVTLLSSVNSSTALSETTATPAPVSLDQVRNYLFGNQRTLEEIMQKRSTPGSYSVEVGGTIVNKPKA